MTPNGTTIQALRQAQGLSMHELARLARLDPATISRIERGQGGVRQETIRRLAEALAVSTDDITRGENDMPPTEKTRKPPREVPSPGTPEGDVFHYTPAEAARYLPYSALTLRRKAYAREIPFNEGGSRITFTGRNIREISDATAVRPLAETTRRNNPAA